MKAIKLKIHNFVKIMIIKIILHIKVIQLLDSSDKINKEKEYSPK